MLNVQALCVLQNILNNFGDKWNEEGTDREDGSGTEDDESLAQENDVYQSYEGYFGIGAAKRAQAVVKHDEIAQAMWDDYCRCHN